MADPIGGAPGTTWTNDTGKIRYQFHCDWKNTCGVCAQYDGMVGPSWPIPFHFSCRCRQSPVYPGKESQPFTDFRAKVETLSAPQKANLVGASNYRLISQGVVSWDDVVTEGRVRDLREVVARKKLTPAQLKKAGVDRHTAAKAVAAVNTPAHALAEEARRKAMDALKAKGLSDEQARRAVAERLAGRVSIGGGPPGPAGPAVPPGPAPRPLTPKQVAESLGLKLKPVPAPVPKPPAPAAGIAAKVAAYREGAAAVSSLADAGGAYLARKARAADLAARIDTALATHAGSADLDDLRLAYRDALDAAARAQKLARAAAADLLKAADPLTIAVGGARLAELAPGAADALKEAASFVGSLTERAGLGTLSVAGAPVPKRGDGRAYYEVGKATVRLGSSGVATAVHELGHMLEDLVPGWGAAAKEFLEYRTAGEALTPLADVLAGDFAPDELGRSDRFADAFGDRAYYVGKDYEGATEITSMGLEQLYRDPASFAAADPEFATFLIGLLKGAFR